MHPLTVLHPIHQRTLSGREDSRPWDGTFLIFVNTLENANAVKSLLSSTYVRAPDGTMVTLSTSGPGNRKKSKRPVKYERNPAPTWVECLRM